MYPNTSMDAIKKSYGISNKRDFFSSRLPVQYNWPMCFVVCITLENRTLCCYSNRVLHFNQLSCGCFYLHVYIHANGGIGEVEVCYTSAVLLYIIENCCCWCDLLLLQSVMNISDAVVGHYISSPSSR